MLLVYFTISSLIVKLILEEKVATSIKEIYGYIMAKHIYMYDKATFDVVQ